MNGFQIVKERLQKLYDKKYSEQKEDLEKILKAYISGEIEHEEYISSKEALNSMGFKAYLSLNHSTELVKEYMEKYKKNRCGDSLSIIKHKAFMRKVGSLLDSLKARLDEPTLNYQIVRFIKNPDGLFIAVPCLMVNHNGSYQQKFPLGFMVEKKEYPYTYNYCIEKLQVYNGL